MILKTVFSFFLGTLLILAFEPFNFWVLAHIIPLLILVILNKNGSKIYGMLLQSEKLEEKLFEIDEFEGESYKRIISKVNFVLLLKGFGKFITFISSNFFEFINLLHPSPALAGFPVNDAKQWIKSNENFILNAIN